MQIEIECKIYIVDLFVDTNSDSFQCDQTFIPPGCLALWRVSREAQPTTSATSLLSWTLTSLPMPSSTSCPR